MDSKTLRQARLKRVLKKARSPDFYKPFIDLFDEQYHQNPDSIFIVAILFDVCVHDLEFTIESGNVRNPRKYVSDKFEAERAKLKKKHLLGPAKSTYCDGGFFNSLNPYNKAVNIKDNYTAGHSSRVQNYAMDIARCMRLSEDEREILKYASILHDVGKLYVPDEILKKPGSLTVEERRIIERHSIDGERLLLSFENHLSRDIATIVRHHHENWDGSGYPDGLKGKQIPLLARILRETDSFDAMTSDRPYGVVMTVPQVVVDLRQKAGTWYDPQINKLFIEILHKGFHEK